MGKTVLILAITAAFVGGSITTGMFAFADISQCDNNSPRGISNGKPFLEMWAAICDLQEQIDNIPEGPPGPPGPASIFATYTIADLVNVAPGAIESLTMECRSGDLVISGGFLDRASPQNLKIIENRPLLTQSGIKWQVTGENLGTANAVLKGQALCAAFP